MVRMVVWLKNKHNLLRKKYKEAHRMTGKCEVYAARPCRRIGSMQMPLPLPLSAWSQVGLPPGCSWLAESEGRWESGHWVSSAPAPTIRLLGWEFPNCRNGLRFWEATINFCLVSNTIAPAVILSVSSKNILATKDKGCMTVKQITCGHDSS